MKDMQKTSLHQVTIFIQCEINLQGSFLLEGTPTRTNTHDSDSIISSATEVTVSDLSELDDHLQQLRGQLQSSPNGSGNSTPMTTEDKSEQDMNLRRRTT